MKVTKKKLWFVIAILAILLVGESYICRDHLKETTDYYKSKVQRCYKNYKLQKEALGALQKFISCDVPKKSVIIFEPNPYHHECMPGYAKYFVDLGYKVDVLIQNGNEDSLDLFEPKDKLRIFKFGNLDQINLASSELKEKFSKYDYALLHSSDPSKKETIKSLGFFENPNARFIAHDTDFIELLAGQRYYNEDKVLTLGEFNKGLYVNPHYFGDIPKHQKNQKTRFFVTSTAGRNYSELINACLGLKSKGLNFELLVTGRSDELTETSIPPTLRENFVFERNIPYRKMYDEIAKCDYILMLLNPENEYDCIFKSKRATGTAQLAYGFCKPVIANESFADFYKLDCTNSIIYKNRSLAGAVEKAVKLSSDEYLSLCEKMRSTTQDIYEKSLKNLLKSLH